MTTLEKSRPQLSSSARSFSRYEPPKVQTPTRTRASTLASELLSPVAEPKNPEQSIFDNGEAEAPAAPLEHTPVSTSSHGGLHSAFDELPIELVSLTDRFITSLTTAKIYPTPPPIDKLTELFQEFYLQAESHILTHVQTLATRQSREASPAPSISSRASGTSKTLTSLGSKPSRESLAKVERLGTGQQMLTPSEISERRKARRMLELKKVALEEAVERRVCETVYNRIWRHRSSLDEVNDEKLRSKTAALALVGISLEDLGVKFDPSFHPDKTPSNLQHEIEDLVSQARNGLLQMNESYYPLGKLQSLASTHQKIVDLLSTLYKSSSSADEVLPTLIYTLITCPPEGISIVSNLNFIQRFRSSSKINGEAAYCLTNLEAAITFLENVDLATLRSDEAMDTNSTSHSHPATPAAELGDPLAGSISTARATSPVTTPLTAVPPRLEAQTGQAVLSSLIEKRPSSPPSPLHSRRLSSLLQPSANAFGAASDAVRNSADQTFHNISSTLDNSFKLLFGRLKEQQQNQAHAAAANHMASSSATKDVVLLPKTLDEARRLVSPKPILDEDGNISEASSFADQDDNSPREDSILEMITGKTLPRDRSADSNASASKRIAFQSNNDATKPLPEPVISASPPLGSGPLSAVESMRSLGNSLNPLNRLSGINVMRGFGRSAGSSPAMTPSPLAANDPTKQLGRNPEKAGATMGSVSAPTTAKIEPPVQRFLEVSDAAELKLGEVEVLLREYQRLAKVVKGMKFC